MDDAAKIILKKLEEIDHRLRTIESEKKTGLVVSQKAVSPQINKDLKDPLFNRAVQIIERYDEVPATLLQRLLSVDMPRAEKILDQLEQAGLGQCVWEER